MGVDRFAARATPATLRFPFPFASPHPMDLVTLLRAVLGLGVTLGLVGLAAYAARRWGPAGLLQARSPEERRLQVLETLALDPQRRLVLVRVDAEERLLLLGEGRVVDASAPGASSGRSGRLG